MEKYVCVLATNNYLDGCLILNENLKHLNSKYELLCLINEGISEESKNILDYFNIKYKEVNKINYDVDYEDFEQDYYKNTFDKLSIFQLTEYKKIVYLDLDLLILENIDDLFCYNGPAMAYDHPFSNLHNSGVMVIEPNINDYNGLIKIMIKRMKKQEQLGDQNIINEYFKVINTLPQSYNLMRQLYDDIRIAKLPIWDDKLKTYIMDIHDTIDDKKILHYINCPKPFQVKHPYQEKYSYLYTYYMCLVNDKKKEYEELKQKKELK